jgi:hypothetical protein
VRIKYETTESGKVTADPWETLGVINDNDIKTSVSEEAQTSRATAASERESAIRLGAQQYCGERKAKHSIGDMSGQINDSGLTGDAWCSFASDSEIRPVCKCGDLP